MGLSFQFFYFLSVPLFHYFHLAASKLLIRAGAKHAYFLIHMTELSVDVCVCMCVCESTYV